MQVMNLSLHNDEKFLNVELPTVLRLDVIWHMRGNLNGERVGSSTKRATVNYLLRVPICC